MQKPEVSNFGLSDETNLFSIYLLNQQLLGMVPAVLCHLQVV